MLSEIRHIEKDKYYMVSHGITFIWILKQGSKNQALRHRKKTGGCQRWRLRVGEMGGDCQIVQTSS